MIKEILLQYRPKNEQEEVDKLAMLAFIDKNDDYLDRENLVAHFTSSAIIINEEKTKVLFIHHNIYNSWGWVGGHNDGEEDCLHVAIKEAKEETGVINIYPLDEEVHGIDTIYVPNHIKKGKYVPDHVHMNLTYILVADERDQLFIKEDENSGVKWMTFEDAFNEITEPRMVPVYEKLFYVIKNYDC